MSDALLILSGVKHCTQAMIVAINKMARMMRPDIFFFRYGNPLSFHTPLIYRRKEGYKIH